MRRNRKVKIIATLGPASSTPLLIEKLFEAGADVFRINMSHTSHDMLTALHRSIRAVEEKLERPIGILVDLQGPKIRIGSFANGMVTLSTGQRFVFDLIDQPGDEKRVFLPHREIFLAAKIDDCLLLNDGKIRVKIVSTSAEQLETEVIYGGVLSDRKGVNLPNTILPIAALTSKDRLDLEAAVSLGVDWIGLSFVQRAEDIVQARQCVKARAGIMAKIEKPSALLELDKILELADGIMVARGDLGVELPLETVPAHQKQLVRAARWSGRPVIVATQMLESMITESVPTRAEVSDVANAVYEGADAIMLSAESASGKWPVEAVTTMDKIAQAIESDHFYHDMLAAQRNQPQSTTVDAVSAAARQITETLHLATIVCYTASGSTGLRVARERAEAPIIALTPNRNTARRLSLVWGLHCVLTRDAQDLDDMVERACLIAYGEGFAKIGERIIISVGVPLGTPGATNMLRVAFVGKSGSMLERDLKFDQNKIL